MQKPLCTCEPCHALKEFTIQKPLGTCEPCRTLKEFV